MVIHNIYISGRATWPEGGEVKVKHNGCHGTSVPGGVVHLELNAYHCAQKHAAHTPRLCRLFHASTRLLLAPYTPLTRLYTPLHASYAHLTRLLHDSYTPLPASYTSPGQPAALLCSTHLTLICYSHYSDFLWFTRACRFSYDRALSERQRQTVCVREDLDQAGIAPCPHTH